MSFVQVLSLLLLLCCLLIAVWRRINIGVLGLSATFVIALLSHTPAAEVYKSFPGKIFSLIVGVSLLFAHLERSGAIRTLTNAVFRLIGPHRWLVPWAAFCIAVALSTAGAFSTATISLLVPVVGALSIRDPRNFFVSEMGVVIGANLAGLSPLNPTGATVREALNRTHTDYPVWGLWLIAVLFAVAAVLSLQLFQKALLRAGRGPIIMGKSAEEAGEQEVTAANHVYSLVSWLGLAAFILGVVVFGTDVGLTAFAIALVLQLLFRPSEKSLLSHIPWNAVLLLCGLLTYLGLIQQIGTMDVVQDWLGGVSSVVALIFIIAYTAAVLSNIESSTLGVLTLLAPILGATIGSGSHVLWAVAAMCVPAALTVMNPVHVAGTLIIANAAEEEQSRAFPRLFATAVTLSLIAPAIGAGVAALFV